ncbi:MAG: histidine phosphatase family protein, partial [Acetobacteraceae bacterium]
LRLCGEGWGEAGHRTKETMAETVTAASLAPIPFWFLRHGETDWNARNLSQGNIDVPLNQTGLAQARSAAELLKFRGVREIVASPLSRARTTAEIVGEALTLTVRTDADLRETAFGVQVC